MRLRSKLGLLLCLLLLKPACGGGGGGGGGGTGVSFPALPPLVSPAPAAASLAGTAFPPIALNGAAAAHTVDATAGRTDAQVLTDLQAAMDLGGKTTIDTGGVARSILMTSIAALQLVVHQSTPSPVILEGNDFVTLDGNLMTRMFDMEYLTSLQLQRIHFVRGRAAQNGGAINAGTPINNLTVLNCTFVDCQTVEGGPDRGGGAIRAWNTQHTQISRCTFDHCAASNGGAVNSLGSRLTIIESTFTQNAAFGTGGGADAGPTGHGGIGGAVYVDNVSNAPAALHQMVYAGCLFNANVANDQAGAVFGYMNPAVADSTMIVEACTFCGNRLLGSSGGAIYTLNGLLTLTNSTFNANTAASGNSGAIRLDNNPSNVTNCTFQGNHASIGGALGKFSGTLLLQSVTVAENTSDTFSGGIFVSVPAANITINKSIFANNTGVNAFVGWQTNVTIPNGDGNVQFPAAGAQPNLVLTTSGTTSGDPLLNPLAANGGPTYTMSLGGGSPAINLAPASGPVFDQRGTARDVNPDAGAFEN